MPEVTATLSRDGRPEYRVHDKLFLCLRGPRKDAIDPDTGERMDDVLMIRTLGPDAKAAYLADASLPLFTTPHFDGYPAVLLRLRDLDSVATDVLNELVEQAWEAKAPKRLVTARQASS